MPQLNRWLIALLSLSTAGCSLFQARHRVDVAPFAKSTINLVADINYGLDATKAAYLRPYAGGEPVAEYRAHWESFRPVLRGIGVYSLGLVTLSRSDITEPEKAQQLAVFLERMFANTLLSDSSRLQIPAERVAEILEEIRVQETFLDGLNAAQPIVDEITRYSGDYLDVIKDAQDRTEAWILQQVETDFEPFLSFERRTKLAQVWALQSLSRLGDYRQGRDDQAIARLLEEYPEIRPLVADPANPGADELVEVEDFLVSRLARLQSLKEQIAFDLETYRNMSRELDVLVQDANNNLRRTRLTIYVWGNAHRRLAQGITDPARLDIMGVAQQALDAALPMLPIPNF